MCGDIVQHLTKKVADLGMFKKGPELEMSEVYIERKIYSKIYTYALLPNGDTGRDEKYNEILEVLEKNISMNGADVLETVLGIPQKFQVGAPWSPAITELKMLNAFTSPKDKVQCIGLTCRKIVHLLRLSQPSCEVGADDILPVLIYVLIHA